MAIITSSSRQAQAYFTIIIVELRLRHRRENDVYEMAVLESLELTALELENCTTVEDFVKSGKEAVRPMIDEYKRLFVHPNGDYNQGVCAFTGSHFLNPMAAMKMTVEQIKDCIKDPSHFGFDEFCEGYSIIQDLIDEIPHYMAVVSITDESFWSSVDGAAEYDAALVRKIEMYPENHSGKT
mmetsp:Transcript_24565/g.52935  ORF Transcript_24565/g.52935 Transcript_24565/m.52935 type:complete len:182 (-) Transcript_24565:801-1346(-)|eukprot:CAMPEP_0172324612 /NCGR_PEP_ID=MMETSP1058-20130122/51780_1 /TAXON_ID=83371 /ORGANISM="Detonula confervacea, Strain CCMP 353" /LENGTH=181 /DNA_ID=CAMNT_0013040929 /DNA_START=93 /DNA_END=638 /DNA_ORIENTATION=-